MRPGCHSLTESNRAKYLDCHQPISRKVRWRVTFGIDSYLMRYKEVGASGILLVDGRDERRGDVRSGSGFTVGSFAFRNVHSLLVGSRQTVEVNSHAAGAMSNLWFAVNSQVDATRGVLARSSLQSGRKPGMRAFGWCRRRTLSPDDFDATAIEILDAKASAAQASRSHINYQMRLP
jgi:hypothetical protein